MAVEPYTLSQDLYAKLLQAERDLTDIVKELDKAEACDYDCRELRAMQEQKLAWIAKVKQNYAPKVR